MRLLHAETITLELFPDDRLIPPYAVLSHTWGGEEVTFQEMTLSSSSTSYESKAGFSKIRGCCARALADGLSYVWVDTCCIDKASSAELSEAINSMFRWYQQARICYAYLVDVPANPDRHADVYHEHYAAYQACRWFTRGWTLQELLAPADVHFFDAGWHPIGSKIANLGAIEKITGIGRRFLRDAGELRYASVAQRMAWAADRRTTRSEDQAYCLLGIFGINMPLLYGEGGPRSFVRLQEEIMRESDDQSLFAWGLGSALDEPGYAGGLFATSPRLFAGCAGIVFWGQLATQRPAHYFLTNKGLRIEAPLVAAADGSGTAYAVLDCLSDMRFVGLPLSRAYHDDVYQRTRGSVPRTLSSRLRARARWGVVYVQKDPPANSLTMYFSVANVTTASLAEHGYRLVDAHPPHAVLSVAPDKIVCGDAHSALLLFRRGGDDRRTLALLVTAEYRPGEHDLSRPVLEDMRWQLAPGPRPRRLAKLVLEHGLERIGRALKLGDRAVVGGDVVTTRVVEKTYAGWTVAVDVDASGRVPEPPASAAAADSDSDDMERISMDAMAAMVKNTNRDFRQRQTWARQQKRTRAGVRGRWPWALAAALLGLVWAGAFRRLDGASWVRGHGAFLDGSYPFYVTVGGLVVACFALTVWPVGAARKPWR